MELRIGKDFQAGIVLALIALIVYANSLGNGFVWDDDLVILSNSALKENPLELLRGIDSGRTTDIAPYYRPLTLFSFFVEGRLHGFNPYLMRLFNVLLHCANTFLVYRLVCLFNLSDYGAFLAGILFAVHPLNSESVDFIAGGRNTMLATFFALSSYLSYQHSLRNSYLGLAFVGAFLFLAGLLSKETALAILPFIVCIEYGEWSSGVEGAGKQSAVRLIPFLAAFVVYLALRHNALSHAGAALDLFPGLASRLADNVFILPRYLFNVVWPFMLSPKYFIPDDLNLYALPLLCAWLGISGIIWWLCSRGRSKAALFGLGWMFAFWLPVSGIFPIPSAPLADRYCYMPAIGFWLVIGDQLSMLFPLKKATERAVLVATATLILLLAAVTVRHNTMWHDDIALFTRMIELYPDQAYGYHNLGCAYLDKVKNIDLAEKSFERALALDPYFPRLRTQIGFVQSQRGYYEGALSQYDHAVFLNPLDAEALLNRGMVMERLGRYSEARDSYRRFLLTPGNELPEARRAIPSKISELSKKLTTTVDEGK